ncbi:hypothetical protein I79_014599 [Cricetulus griseus]|uniref:Uncharacterized protein n=1 Tax=Cricetulus griseus TaxID=10029 RepID=G3HUI8_CRIGR|nr:hypothetical protein I79_014599 [Cricetulus griseus]
METALAATSYKQNYLPGNLLKGKVICWNLSQTISRKEPSKVIGHVCREIDVVS